MWTDSQIESSHLHHANRGKTKKPQIGIPCLYRPLYLSSLSRAQLTMGGVGKNALPPLSAASFYNKIGFTVAVVFCRLGGALPHTPASSKEQEILCRISTWNMIQLSVRYFCFACYLCLLWVA